MNTSLIRTTLSTRLGQRMPPIMASSTFTPSQKVTSLSNPRDWAYELACLPPSATIVFTKESLLSFLKTHNIEVSPNYTEINKLPRYAQIGTMTSGAPTTATQPAAKPVSSTDDVTEKVEAMSTNDTKQPSPSAPVQNQPIEPSVAAVAPVNPADQQQAAAAAAPTSPATEVYKHDQVRMHNANVMTADGAEFRPTRRVREPIGGGSALISALFGGQDAASDEANLAEATRDNARRRGLLQETSTNDNANAGTTTTAPAVKTLPEEPNVFRPTRRVREPGGTGGTSNISLG